MEDYQKAELDYIKGMKYKDIAAKYGKSLNTVKSWKQRYSWSKEKTEVDLKKENKSMHTKQKSVRTKKFIDEQIEISNNSDLTEREELFCTYYSQFPNQTKAYMRAFDNNNYKYCANQAWLLMKKSRIIERIRQLKRGAQESALLEVADVVNELKKQAFTDVSDYLEYGPEKVLVWERDRKGNNTTKPIIDPATNEQKFYIIDTVHLKNTSETDTTAVKSVKLNKDGHIELEMYDKQKALLELLKQFNGGIYDARFAKAQAERAESEAEMSKIKVENAKPTETQDNALSSFLDTLMSAADVELDKEKENES